MGYKKVQPDTFTIIKHLGIEAQIPLELDALDHSNTYTFLNRLAQKHNLDHCTILQKVDYDNDPPGMGSRIRLELLLDGRTVLKQIDSNQNPENLSTIAGYWRNDSITIKKAIPFDTTNLGAPTKSRIDIVWSNFNGNRDVHIEDNIYQTSPTALNLELQCIMNDNGEIIKLRIEIEASTTDPENLSSRITAQLIYNEIQTWLSSASATTQVDC